jgi:ornithine cyclodeaminase/alanine dehydrogenase-like protein (mu-crystallin family)
MPLHLIDSHYVRRELTLERCIPVIREAMVALSAGSTAQTLRQIIPLGDGALFGVMQGALGAGAPFGTKALSVFPHNHAHGLPSHQGLMLLFDPDTGRPSAIVDAGAITAIRTAAASAVATDVLARPDARRLAVLGAGEQARMHVRAMAEVRPISDIRVWTRSSERAAAFAEAMREELEIAVSASDTVADTVAGAEIICTTTSAADPVLHSAWVEDGAHLNVVGSSHGRAAEIDNALVARARFFPDHRESVLNQGGEYLRASAEGLVDETHVLDEIGRIIAQPASGRRSARDVTLYKSLGNIVQDLASAAFLVDLASRRGDVPTFDP